MKQHILFAAMGVAAFGAGAQEVGHVLSSVPVIQQVAVPRTYCNQPTYVQPQTSGGGGLLGALIGAGLGSTIGHGTGRGAAMVAGGALGAIVGNQVEANNQVAYAQPACGTETTYENRTVGYNVTYEYAGRQYTMQMPYDPGPTVQLQISPMTQAAPGASGGPVVVAPPVVQSGAVVVPTPSPVVYAPYPAYPAYPTYPYPVYRPYFPVGVSLGFVVGGHRHHHRH
jgi:uncharacterized protein YcfJ